LSGTDDPTWVGEATYVGDATFAEDGGDGATDVPLLAGRYRVGRLLGRGGTGQVHEALDVTTEERVAIKFVAQRSQSARRQLRQELTALRLLALPGVVRLHDDGEQGDQTYLVMDLLDGGGFDRLAGPWDGWKEQARALLEAVARVHFAGVHHLDLKPGNVLLDAEGRPVITDFGLARGRSVHNPQDAPREGTPRYMAPEQWRGEETTAATDLYAVGGIFWEMLAGRTLPSGPGSRVLPADAAPEAVRATVAAMLAQDPAQRPQTAVEVLEALFDVTAVLGPEELGLPEVAAGPEELEGLFDEDKPTFLHLARDAAKVLYELTGGERGKVRAELDRWVRAGLAWWNGERVHIERPAIEQLQWGLDPESRRLAELARSDPEGALDHGLAHAEWLAENGEGTAAVGILEALLPLSRDMGRQAEVVRELAIRSFDGSIAVKRVLYHAIHVRDLAAISLARTIRAASQRDWANCIEEADRTIGTQPGARVRYAALAQRVMAHAQLDLGGLRAWLGDEPSLVPVPIWRTAWGMVSYLRGDYEAATKHHLCAAEVPHFGRRMASLSNAAAAAVEWSPPEAEQVLRRIAKELSGRTSPSLELRCHWLNRVVRYRIGAPLRPQPEMVLPARAVSLGLAAHVAHLEAAVAWREGDESLVVLAREAIELYQRVGYEPGVLLMKSLLTVVEPGATQFDVVALLDIRPSEIALQALALAKLGGAAVSDVSHIIASALRERPGERSSLRLDVLSVGEAIEILRSDGLAPSRRSQTPR